VPQDGNAKLRDRVAAVEWYHTLELAPGIVTPGWLDHRPVCGRIPLPESLVEQRCLDVGTFNGFWAFEMERRGAKEVIGIDVLDPHRWDWPPASDPATIEAIGKRMAAGAGFEIAREAMGSRVERIDCSIYDLNERDLGRFDVVYVGSLLVHLRDPVRALERVRSVCRGMLIVVDGIDLPLSLRSPRLPVARLDGLGRPWWWYPNLAGLSRIVEAAGFTRRKRPEWLFVPPGAAWNPSRANWRAAVHREGRNDLLAAWAGDPHGIVVATPR
jgi:tRNA (mo5U34)-methyltransferase